jgi:CheY-like chemotaxis protein
MRILLVADHPSAAAQVKGAVEGWRDAAVLHVSMPKRALALIDEGERFDVVVADNDTAPTGGLALCREVKARGQMGRDVPPVVLLIARTQDRWLANWAQADAHVLKPADPFDLREAIEAVAAGQPVPALPGIGSDPKPSLLDPSPSREVAARTGAPGRPDEARPDELPESAGGSQATVPPGAHDVLGR